MNWDQIEGKWKQVQGKVLEKWGKLTNDYIDQITWLARFRRDMGWPKSLRSVRSTIGCVALELSQRRLPPSLSGPPVGILPTTQKPRPQAVSLLVLLIERVSVPFLVAAIG